VIESKMLIWKFFYYKHLPITTKLTVWYEYSYPITFYEYDQSVYRITQTTTELLFPSATLLRSTHADMYNHYLCIQTQSTVRLYEIPTLNLRNELSLPTDLVSLIATNSRIVCKDRYGVPTLYCLDWANNIIYTHTTPGTLLAYAHTIPADYYVYKDKIVYRSNTDNTNTTRKLPFWLLTATINFILTEPYCFGVSENGRIFMVNLWRLFSSDQPGCMCQLSIYNYLYRASIGFDVWSSEDVSVIIVSKALLEKAMVIQKTDRILSFPIFQ